MTKAWQKHLIQACKANILSLLDEIAAADDLDLWNEADGKLNDVILVHRRKGQPVPPSTFTFSDGITRNLTAMALSHAREQFADECGELDGDEWPALVQNGGHDA